MTHFSLHKPPPSTFRLPLQSLSTAPPSATITIPLRVLHFFSSNFDFLHKFVSSTYYHNPGHHPWPLPSTVDHCAPPSCSFTTNLFRAHWVKIWEFHILVFENNSFPQIWEFVLHLIPLPFPSPSYIHNKSNLQNSLVFNPKYTMLTKFNFFPCWYKTLIKVRTYQI